MSDDEGIFGGIFGGLFDDEQVQQRNDQIPVAPPLLRPDGSAFVVPAHLAKMIVVGHNAQANEFDADELPCRFPVPLLRRNMSLSKNTAHALQGRLAELAADALTAEFEHRRRLAELDHAISTEKLQFAERASRMQRERAAVDAALQKQMAEAAAAAAATAAAATAVTARPAGLRSPATSSGGACLQVCRSAGEDETGAETGCGVCLDADRDTLCAPCGHVALCFTCADAIKQSKNPECPFCRCRITAVYKLFIV